MIESNSTYRGWFVGGNQSGDWSNKGFVASKIEGRGKLGDFFVRQMADIKMGDTPTVAWLLHGDPWRHASPNDSSSHRHRSAYRLVNGLNQSIAVVVSQDGDVRFVAHHNGKLTYWPYLPQSCVSS